MQQIGVYEQLITQLVARNLDRTRFYVGERELSSNEASVWLSRFLSKIMEFAIAAVPTGDDQLKLQIELANQLLRLFSIWQVYRTPNMMGCTPKECCPK